MDGEQNSVTEGIDLTSNASDKIASARSLFPGAARNVYMNVSVRGLLSTRVKAAVHRYLDEHSTGEWDKQELLATVEETRQRFATLINASPDEIAFTKNASDGLNMIAASLPWKAGDNLILCPEVEHPNNVYPWMNVERRFGVEARSVSPDDGRIPIQQMIDTMDERTRLVTVSTVTFAPGFVTDVGTLTKACRERGVVCVVDAAQSAGVLHTDVEQLGVDALAVATQKGLLAFYGMGFLYCRRQLANQLTPAYLARFGVAVGDDAHETAMDLDRLRLADGARRFDLGNFNYLGATAANASLELLLDIGTRDIEAHVRSLAAQLASGMRDLGLPVAGGEPGPHLGHIVAVGKSGGGRHYTADDPAMNSLYEHLSTNGVKLAIRRGVLRLSMHLYNNDEDVRRVVDLSREWRSAQL